MRLAVLLLVWAMAQPLVAVAAVEYSVEPPRGYGWWLGDRLVHRAVLLPPEGYELDRASLPVPRAVAYWLDLVAAEVAEVTVGTRRGWQVTTEWQTFYAALEPTRQQVPGYRLRFLAEDGGSALAEEVDIPGWAFVTSPIRPILAPSSAASMQPDAGVRPVETARFFRAATGFGLLSLLTLAGLAWQQGWWPFHRRPDRPLSRALRGVRRASDERGRVLALHRGLNAANGAPLLASDLEAFLARHPGFGSQRAALRAFFDQSASMFYGDGANGGADVLPLARRLARIEAGRG